jgi:hypothetical protein
MIPESLKRKLDARPVKRSEARIALGINEPAMYEWLEAHPEIEAYEQRIGNAPFPARMIRWKA